MAPDVVSTNRTSCLEASICAGGTECLDPFGCVTQDFCIPCGIGLVSVAGGRCHNCTDDGKVANRLQTYCERCPPGTAPSHDRSSCESCTGTSWSAFGITCTECAEPAVINPSQTTCAACDPGKGPTHNRTACISCTGTTFSTRGQCQNCEDPNIVDDAHQTCSKCSPGSQPNANRTACLACADLPYSSVDEVEHPTYSSHGVECIPCELPNIVDGTHQSCSRCSAGEQPNEGQTACLRCEGLSYSLDGGSCIGCEAPHVVNGDKAACLKCDAGKGPNANRTDCIRCIGANYSVGGQCLNCPRSEISNEERTSCAACNPGKEALPDQSGCTECTSGKMRSTEFECVQCPAGQIPNEERTSCAACAPGQEALPDQSDCRLCAPGKMRSTEFECVQCPTGQIPNEERTSCAACAPGEEALSDQSDCRQCAPGKMRSTDYQCSVCQGDEVPNPERTDCRLCPQSTIPSENMTECVCKPGTYNMTRHKIRCFDADWDNRKPWEQSTGATNCTPCPHCLRCPRSDQIRLRSEYRFMEIQKDDAERIDGLMDAFECPDGSKSACPGQLLGQMNESSSELTRKSCVDGSAGKLCATCKQDWKRIANGTCVKCGTVVGMELVFLLLLLCSVLGYWFLRYYFHPNRKRLEVLGQEVRDMFVCILYHEGRTAQAEDSTNEAHEDGTPAQAVDSITEEKDVSRVLSADRLALVIATLEGKQDEHLKQLKKPENTQQDHGTRKRWCCCLTKVEAETLQEQNLRLIKSIDTDHDESLDEHEFQAWIHKSLIASSFKKRKVSIKIVWSMLQVITQQPAILKRPELFIIIFRRLPWWVKWVFMWNAPSICSLDYTMRFLLNTVVLPVALSTVVKVTWFKIRKDEKHRKDGDDIKGSTIEGMRKNRDLWLEHRATIMRHVENSPNQEQQTEESDELAKYFKQKRINKKLEQKCLARLNNFTRSMRTVKEAQRSFQSMRTVEEDKNVGQNLREEHRETMKWFLTWKERNDAKQLFRAEYQRLTMRSDYYTVVFLCYPTISRACFDHLNCRRLSEEIIVLDSDYDVECWSTDWMVLGALSVVLIASMLIIPLILTYNMGKDMTNMERQMRPIPHGTHRLKAHVHQDFSYDYGAVVNDYRQGAHYAECLDLYRKLVLLGFLTVITPGSVFQGYCSVIFSLTFMLLHMKMWPYKTRSQNVLKLFADMEVFLVQFTGLLTQLDSERLSIKKSWYTDGPRFNCVAMNASNAADSASCKNVTNLQADQFENGIITATERDDPTKCEAVVDELDQTRAVCMSENAGDGSLYEIVLVVSLSVFLLFSLRETAKPFLPAAEKEQSLLANTAALNDEDDSGKRRCDLQRDKREKLRKGRKELMTHNTAGDDKEPAASRWVEKYSTEKEEYYWEDMSTDPDRIPQKWVEKYNGKTVYWENASTRKTTFHCPETDADVDKFRKLADLIILKRVTASVSISGTDTDRSRGRGTGRGTGRGIIAARTWHGPESAQQQLQQSNQTDNPLHTDSSWEERHSEEHGRKYWVNTSTGERKWHGPASATTQQLQQSNQTDNPLHKDSSWEERHSEEHGRKYWVNRSTRETTWHKPQSAMPHQRDPVLEQGEV
jgi:hypothetical protein